VTIMNFRHGISVESLKKRMHQQTTSPYLSALKHFQPLSSPNFVENMTTDKSESPRTFRAFVPTAELKNLAYSILTEEELQSCTRSDGKTKCCGTVWCGVLQCYHLCCSSVYRLAVQCSVLHCIYFVANQNYKNVAETRDELLCCNIVYLTESYTKAVSCFKNCQLKWGKLKTKMHHFMVRELFIGTNRMGVFV